jgi:hypothetical protein
MQAHLIEISAAVDLGARPVVIVNLTGWQSSPKLNIPDSITLVAPTGTWSAFTRAVKPCNHRD